MKKLLIAITLLGSLNVLSSVETSISCEAGEYTVAMTENVNANKDEPLSLVSVSKAGKVIYKKLYKMQYLAQQDFGPMIGKMETWSYTGFNHDDGMAMVASTSKTEGKSDLFIEINDIDYADGNTLDCKLQR